MTIVAPIFISALIITICGLLEDRRGNLGNFPFMGTSFVAIACGLGTMFYWILCLLTWLTRY